MNKKLWHRIKSLGEALLMAALMLSLFGSFMISDVKWFIIGAIIVFGIITDGVDDALDDDEGS